MKNYTLEELLKMTDSRYAKILISKCIEGLGLYAAQQTQADANSKVVGEIRRLIPNLVNYRNLNEGKTARLLSDFLQSFDNRISEAKSQRKLTEDISDYHAVTVCGLYLYGQEMVTARGDSAMGEILSVSELMKEISQNWDYEPEAADKLTAVLKSEVRTMLDNITLPGQPESGEKVHGYEIRQTILFNNDRGFALAENPGAPLSFVTWQFTNDGGRSYYWGHYYCSEEKTLIDYISRVAEYIKNHTVTETLIPQTPEQDGEK